MDLTKDIKVLTKLTHERSPLVARILALALKQASDGISYCYCGTQLIPLLRGHYRVIKLLLDKGGFGRTYLAEDADKLNKSCVVKQLAPKT